METQPERKPLEKPERPPKPVEPEMPKGLEDDQSSHTPDTEPPNNKRIHEL
jgi:hypothetical protein